MTGHCSVYIENTSPPMDGKSGPYYVLSSSKFLQLLQNIQTALVILLVLIKSPPYSGIKEPFPLILKTIIQSYIMPISGNSTRNTIFHPCKGRTILIAESFPIITPIIIYRTINIIIIQTALDCAHKYRGFFQIGQRPAGVSPTGYALKMTCP